MTEPIVFISTFRLIDGQRPTFEAMFAEVVEHLASTKPRTALFAAYLEPGGSTVRIVHAFPDETALVDHFEGSDERSRSIADIAVPAAFEIYGPAPAGVIEQLRGEAAATGAGVAAFTEPVAGFLRAGGA